MDSAAVKEYLLELQELIVERLEQVDGKKFLRDKWERATGSGGIGKGEGISCIIEEGNVLERGGVAFSHVQGDKMPASATAHPGAAALCRALDMALVSTSANIGGDRPARTYADCRRRFGGQVLVVPGRVGRRKRPSTIRAWAEGRIIRK